MKIYVGDKFYKTESEDDSKDLRIIKIKNADIFRVKYTNGDTATIKRNEIETDYTKIIPDGLLTFNIIDVGKVSPDDKMHLKDVLVALYRIDDLDKGDRFPYAACRQSIEDLFTKQINNNPNVHYAGLSINRDSTPEGEKFEMILACNSIIYSVGCSVYLEDNLDEILSLVDLKKHNIVLSSMASKVDSNTIYGYFPTVKELLDKNYFIQDFRYTFNIYSINTELHLNDNCQVHADEVNAMEDVIKCEMLQPYVIDFSREIDLDEIKRDYILVADATNKLYVVVYDKGEYKNDPYVKGFNHDTRDIIAMLKSAKIPISKNKYNNIL